MPATRKSVQTLYDAVAEEYADFFAGEHDQKPMNREMLERFAGMIRGSGPVADLGCGPGHTGLLLRELGLPMVINLDCSLCMVELAREKYPGLLPSPAPDPTCLQGDILRLPFHDKTLAGEVAFYSIVHFSESEVKAAFLEMFRVLRADGVLLCTFHAGEGVLKVDEFLGKKVRTEVTLFSPVRIEEQLKEAGFKKIEIFEREPYPDIEYPSRRAYIFARK